MFCNKCGKELSQDSTFCTNCGARMDATPTVNINQQVANPNVGTTPAMNQQQVYPQQVNYGANQQQVMNNQNYQQPAYQQPQMNQQQVYQQRPVYNNPNNGYYVVQTKKKQQLSLSN